MKLTRRAFATGLAATSIFPPLRPMFAASESPSELRAAVGTAQLAPATYPPTAVWGYDGGVPGPTIRVSQGARVHRRLVNALPQPTTIHWHGVRIDNAMDGVPGVTQAAVPAGDTFDYDFAAPDAGTYWYHPHNRAWEQMARGLHGALIVEEATPPDVDADEVLLIDDWRLTEKAAIDESFGALHDWAHGGRIGNWVTVNGEGAWERTVAPNARLRLRLVNVANSRIFALDLQGMDAWQVALDGQPLEMIERVESIVLAPAQRVDLLVDVTAEDAALLVNRERTERYAIGRFVVDGISLARRPAPQPLPANAVPPLGALSAAREVTLAMEGGAMGRMGEAMVGGRRLAMRDLMSEGLVWAFNGVAGMPDSPLIEAGQGETVTVRMVNDTAWPHAMHLHGHHFRQVRDGSPGPLRDTVLVEAGATEVIAFVADNPGDWLLHCHMLEHSASGMMTWLRVA